MNPYQVLGVEKDATLKLIKTAYRKLSLTHHPDRGGEVAEFHKIKTAYEVLKDPERRKRYDQTGRINHSRITPERVQSFLDAAFEGVLNANDDIDLTNVPDKMGRTIANGARQAYAEKDNLERKIRRAEILMKRTKAKNPDDTLIHGILKKKVDRLIEELENTKDAIELATTCIERLKDFQYEVDPAPEGPLNARPTFATAYGGRSSTTTGWG